MGRRLQMPIAVILDVQGIESEGDGERMICLRIVADNGAETMVALPIDTALWLAEHLAASIAGVQVVDLPPPPQGVA